MKITTIDTDSILDLADGLISYYYNTVREANLTDYKPDNSQIKFIIDVAECNAPKFLLNSTASLYRKKLALKTWQDKDEGITLNKSAYNDFYLAQLESTLNDDSIDDDIAEEIYKCLNIGFNLRLFLYDHPEFLNDINKIKQITYAAENYVSLAEIMQEEGDSITAEELFKFRIEKQNQAYMESKKILEEYTIEESVSNE